MRPMLTRSGMATRGRRLHRLVSLLSYRANKGKLFHECIQGDNGDDVQQVFQPRLSQPFETIR
jgi:hypothetical protein